MRKLDLLSCGVASDADRIQTIAIQDIIDTLSREGGGTLVVPEGTFCTGALHLGRNVNLRVDGTLRGSCDLKDYPMRKTRYEGRTDLWPDALVNAEGSDALVISGTGTIDGNGIPFYTEFWKKRELAIKMGKPFVNHNVPRPRLLFVSHCRNVAIKGLHLMNSGFWTIHLYESDDVVVENVSVSSPHEPVRAASTDGIDVDACQHVTIRDSSFSVDDDCICIKGGKGPDAHLVNRPTRDVLVERCTVGFGHGVVTFGSEACRVEDVTIRDVSVTDENLLVRFKFRPDTDQLFERIRFERITMRDGWVFSIRPWVNRQDEVLGGGLPSVIRGLVVKDVVATGVKSPGIIKAAPPLTTIEGLDIENVCITTGIGRDAMLSRHDRFEETDVADPKRLSVFGLGSYEVHDFTIDGECMDCLEGNCKVRNA